MLRLSVLLLVLGLVMAPSAGADNGGFTPVDPESSNAVDIRDMFFFVGAVIVATFLLVHVLLIAFVVRYRRRRRARFDDGVQIHGSTKLELLWTAYPILALAAVATFVFVELPGVKNVPSAGAAEEELQVRILGRQFYWQYEYPNGVVAIDRLRAPAGVPVRLELTAPADDVIHSWWIPALGGKFDTIPGHVNETWFRAERPGTYEGQCGELCGIEHARMLAVAEIMPPAGFEAWLDEREAEQGRSEGSTALGEEEWNGVCAKCHGTEGEGGVAPRIAGSPLLSDRDNVERIVREGIRTMPAVGSGWSDQQITALLRYLEEDPPSGQ